jgi:hypothetical protein
MAKVEAKTQSFLNSKGTFLEVLWQALMHFWLNDHYCCRKTP